jgi:hypothetical protein
MKHASHILSKAFLGTALLGMAAAVLLCTGCQQESDSQATAARKQVTPEESFKEIATLFAQSVQTGAGGMPGGFIAQEEDGHSRLVIKNDVKSQFIPPAKDGEPYRGIITVTSQYDYSLQRIVGSSEQEKGRDEENGDAERRGWDDQGGNILDNDLIKRPSKTRRAESEPAEDIIARRSDEDVKQYELEYVDSRWVLKTPLNPDTERSIENAFDHILSLQP